MTLSIRTGSARVNRRGTLKWGRLRHFLRWQTPNCGVTGANHVAAMARIGAIARS